MPFTIFRSQKYQSKITGQSRPFCLFCFGIEPQWAQLTGVYPKLQISQSPWPLALCSYPFYGIDRATSQSPRKATTTQI